MRLLRSMPMFFPVVSVFILTLCFFLFLQAKPMFPDPDSFYHMKVAQLISQQGVLETFPWLTFTPLAEHYTDQHFLYHVLLIPFVHLPNPFLGAKLATALINAALFALLAAFLIRFHVKFWCVPVAVLLATNPFLFRINLVKAPGLSIILLLIGLWLLFRRRVVPLAILGFLYVWTYGGFVLLAVFAGLYALVGTSWDWAHHRALYQTYRRFIPASWHWKTLTRHPGLLALLAVVLGILAGLLINPFFPQNLFFYWQQLVQIGIVNFQHVINVGGEWRPYGFIELLANTVFVSIGVVTATAFFFVRHRKMSAETWTLFLLAAFFFGITLKSRRYVELYVPFATLYAAFAWRDAFAGEQWRELWQTIRKTFHKHIVVGTLMVVYALATSSVIITRDTIQLNNDLKGGFSTTYLANASQWLAAHAPKNSIIVHSDWDEFPILFYHNSEDRYIVGLDPTFMYNKDRWLYQRWADLSSGKISDNAEQVITQDLHSSYVLVASDHDAFNRVMQQLPGAVQVYKDEDATIYKMLSARLPETSFGGGNTPRA